MQLVMLARHGDTSCPEGFPVAFCYKALALKTRTTRLLIVTSSHHRAQVFLCFNKDLFNLSLVWSIDLTGALNMK